MYTSCRILCTGRKVSGSIPNGVIGSYLRLNPSGRTGALGQLNLEQRVPEIFHGGRGGRYMGLTTLPSLHANCLEVQEPQPPEDLRASPGFVH